MPIKAIYDEMPTEPITLGPEDFIETDDGKWMPNVEAVGNVRLEDVGALRGALTKAKKNLGDAQRKLTAFGDHTPESIAELAAAAEAGGDEGGLDEKERAKFEARISAMEKKAKEQGDAHKQALTSFQQSWVDSETERALLEHMTALGAPRELLPIYKQGVRGEMVEADGVRSVSIKVLGENGGPRLTEKPNSSEEMDVAEYVGTFREHPTFSRLFPGTGSSGSGAGNPGGSGQTSAGGVLRIPRGDQAALNANVDKIASGEAVVVD